jgi:predicted RNase H-like HicB family nuclease
VVYGLVPSVFSQGETIEELKENIRDAYRLMLETKPTLNRTNVILSSSHYLLPYIPLMILA